MNRTVFFVSDQTGVTAETMGHSLMTQFEGRQFRAVTLPFVSSVDKADEARRRIDAAATEDGLRPIVFGTIVQDEVRAVLERTLGVPIFQEQVMQLAVVAAGFSPGEADQLRRSMAAWKRHGGLDHFEQRLIQGMLARGYSASFAQQIYQQMLGFGEYGFPESHSASFALLVYVSAWLKCHHPAAFVTALLNSQPMGFYAPSQLVQDARRHGVEVRPVSVNHSHWECRLEAAATTQHAAEHAAPAVRLGLCLVKGLRQSAAQQLVQARGTQLFQSLEQLARRSALSA
ncbi:MAG: hypothetical protein EBR15_08165, partial [Gammaproteobacteria bacterium]|nr:hypothetical protein [Gammaproteobacteria bacterium]